MYKNCLFFQWIFEAPNDFRIDRHSLNSLKFAIFGIGDSAYFDAFNKCNEIIYNNLVVMGAQPILPLYKADQSGKGLGVKEGLNEWAKCIADHIFKEENKNSHVSFVVLKTKNPKVYKGKGKHFVNSQSGYINKLKEYKEGLQDDTQYFSCKSPIVAPKNANSTTDVEDIGIVLKNVKIKLAFKGDNVIESTSAPQMLTQETRDSLTKQGYKVVGSHSAVKICRWTKSALRGRGGCYKHTFYGIDSSRCIESTPSLACANKCVFCWRHHSNPVGTEWKWQMDEPETIFKEIVSQHKAMIKQCKGIPGVTMEKFNQALIPRHCALSLVGEPIMYPRINDFIRLLHEAKISTFLVTNAQFPEQIINLKPVTQLYVSIDAHDSTSLKRIDRPLHRDFWERFIACLKAVFHKKGVTRTVYRLTLVKKWNFSDKYCNYVKLNNETTSFHFSLTNVAGKEFIYEESLKNSYMELFDQDIRNYVELIKLGHPDFIEIKGVTYCGTAGNELTMKDIPWHSDVLEFGTALAQACNHPYNFLHKYSVYEPPNDTVRNFNLPQYEIACEHEHSNCVLLADTKFKINNIWHTWIDYEKFNHVVLEYYDALKSSKTNILAKDIINSLEYSCSTPHWGHMGSNERGFDPGHTRMTGFNRDAKRKEIEGR